MSTCVTPASATGTETSSPWFGQGAAAAALFLIGTSAPVAAVLENYPILGGQAARFLLAAVVLFVLLLVFDPAPRVHLSWSVLAGLALLGLVGIAGFNVFLVAASRQADPAVVATVLAAAPVVLAVFAPLLDRRSPGVWVVTGCALVAAGTTLAAGSGATGGVGALLCTGTLVCELVFTLVAVPLIRRIGAWRTTAHAVLAAGVWLVLGAVAVHGAGRALAVPTPGELASLVYMALVVGVVANLLWYVALPRVGADRAGLFYAVTPLGGLCAGLLLGTSSPGAGEIVGVVTATTGLALGLAPARAPHHSSGRA